MIKTVRAEGYCSKKMLKEMLNTLHECVDASIKMDELNTKNEIKIHSIDLTYEDDQYVSEMRYEIIRRTEELEDDETRTFNETT